ncbi:MAG: C40 family peptidase, partial [Candidatus Omnitrophica bacterium]|nr:C40 family peptidase [Candidatus Omnitrophota bacterium]
GRNLTPNEFARFGRFEEFLANKGWEARIFDIREAADAGRLDQREAVAQEDLARRHIQAAAAQAEFAAEKTDKAKAALLTKINDSQTAVAAAEKELTRVILSVMDAEFKPLRLDAAGALSDNRDYARLQKLFADYLGRQLALPQAVAVLRAAVGLPAKNLDMFDQQDWNALRNELTIDLDGKLDVWQARTRSLRLERAIIEALNPADKAERLARNDEDMVLNNKRQQLNAAKNPAEQYQLRHEINVIYGRQRLAEARQMKTDALVIPLAEIELALEEKHYGLMPQARPLLSTENAARITYENQQIAALTKEKAQIEKTLSDRAVKAAGEMKAAAGKPAAGVNERIKAAMDALRHMSPEQQEALRQAIMGSGKFSGAASSSAGGIGPMGGFGGMSGFSGMGGFGGVGGGRGGFFGNENLGQPAAWETAAIGQAVPALPEVYAKAVYDLTGIWTRTHLVTAQVTDAPQEYVMPRFNGEEQLDIYVAPYSWAWLTTTFHENEIPAVLAAITLHEQAEKATGSHEQALLAQTKAAGYAAIQARIEAKQKEFEPAADDVSPELVQRLKALVHYWTVEHQVPYVWGGGDESGIDCSHFVNKWLGGNYLTAKGLYEKYQGQAIALDKVQDAYGNDKSYSLDNLMPGDVLVFQFSEDSWHTAVYLGNHQIVHSNHGGVKVASLDEGWCEHYKDIEYLKLAFRPRFDEEIDGPVTVNADAVQSIKAKEAEAAVVSAVAPGIKPAVVPAPVAAASNSTSLPKQYSIGWNVETTSNGSQIGVDFAKTSGSYYFSLHVTSFKDPGFLHYGEV